MSDQRPGLGKTTNASRSRSARPASRTSAMTGTTPATVQRGVAGRPVAGEAGLGRASLAVLPPCSPHHSQSGAMSVSAVAIAILRVVPPSLTRLARLVVAVLALVPSRVSQPDGTKSESQLAEDALARAWRPTTPAASTRRSPTTGRRSGTTRRTSSPTTTWRSSQRPVSSRSPPRTTTGWPSRTTPTTRRRCTTWACCGRTWAPPRRRPSCSRASSRCVPMTRPGTTGWR